ncbi:MAG: thiamine diphosphokinase [Reichenbachiella sp.]
MKTNKVFLLLNGETPCELPDLTSYDLICATDGAYQYLEKNKITPDFISGDFDSVKSIPDHIEVIHTPDQDFTDFDKVLQILFNKGYSAVDVYGASGKEQDHFLGNLHTAIQWKDKMNLTFFDNHSSYFMANKTNEVSTSEGKIVSLFPFPTATGITTKGLQYPLNHENLSFGTRIGTRNVAIENEVSITFESGDLFIFIGR